MRFNDVICFELETRDVNKSQEFYKHVFQWKSKDDIDNFYGMYQSEYDLSMGYMVCSEQDRMSISIFVENIDITIQKVIQNGGTVVENPRLSSETKAYITDPMGNTFIISSTVNSGQNNTHFMCGNNQKAKNIFQWFMISTNDFKKTEEFYNQVFNWDFIKEDMDESQEYYSIQVDGHDICGGVSVALDKNYFIACISVENISEIKSNIVDNGGQIIEEIHLPFMTYVLVKDICGAIFMVENC